MKIEKLELRHIAPYLPYGLKFMMESKPNSKEPNVDELKSIDVGLKMVNFGWGNAKYFIEIKPILRSLSDLIKIINHNNKDVVPITELRCIEQGYEDNGRFYLDHTQITDFGVKGEKDDIPCYWIEWNDTLRQTQLLSFKKDDFNRFWIIDKRKIGGINMVVLNNRLRLFEKLFEWHFDIFGLIEKGLAISINDI